MYYIDSHVRRVDAFDYDLKTHKIESRRVAFYIPEEMGGPDGMAIDSEDTLWVAPVWGSKVSRWQDADKYRRR